MTETIAPEPTPEQAALFLRVRRLMLIAGLTTALAIAAVLIAIGYRLFRTEGSSVATDVTATLPKGARIVCHRGRRRPAGGDAGYRRDDRNPHLRHPHAEARRPADLCRRTLTRIMQPGAPAALPRADFKAIP